MPSLQLRSTHGSTPPGQLHHGGFLSCFLHTSLHRHSRSLLASPATMPYQPRALTHPCSNVSPPGRNNREASDHPRTGIHRPDRLCHQKQQTQHTTTQSLPNLHDKSRIRRPLAAHPPRTQIPHPVPSLPVRANWPRQHQASRKRSKVSPTKYRHHLNVYRYNHRLQTRTMRSPPLRNVH